MGSYHNALSSLPLLLPSKQSNGHKAFSQPERVYFARDPFAHRNYYEIIQDVGEAKAANGGKPLWIDYRALDCGCQREGCS